MSQQRANDERLKPLVITNFDPRTDDVIYTNERGAWNVSRALRDCRAGMHLPYTLDLAECYAANAAVEVDAEKVARILALLDTDDFEPGIGVMEDGAIWLIDGHHRLRAMHLHGDKDFICYVIEADAAAPYVMTYNGERLPPFAL